MEITLDTSLVSVLGRFLSNIFTLTEKKYDVLSDCEHILLYYYDRLRSKDRERERE